MKKISVSSVLLLHKILIQHSGGSGGLRDIGLLESALNAPFAEYDGISICPSLESKAAKLAFGLIKNHPFVDANKRIGILVMLSFLELNGILIACTDEELIELGIGLADGTLNEKDVLAFIINHS